MAARDLKPSLKMMARKLNSQSNTSANTCDKVGKLVLSTIMAYWCNYFGFAFVVRWQQFFLANALHAAQKSWEAENQLRAALNG